ncbi:hypothetical protein GT348_07705 [Aristophania vespae]|uniref:Helix-turn-helix domain-containing protein n=1 Tax=Aristophania vespae TaxID=2697033 RepID=A0A6P1NKF2_9PROT|nr:hypothetical protein [Aristophania vespae]QHI96132.1 hypothetical protein GT348_07705 [Aristophania vespae]UMM63911.1 hypothetical protein DM15PD_08910 [Aristophania vespae]
MLIPRIIDASCAKSNIVAKRKRVQTKWTSDKISLLRSLYNENYSYKEMAFELSVSRFMVDSAIRRYIKGQSRPIYTPQIDVKLRKIPKGLKLTRDELVSANSPDPLPKGHPLAKPTGWKNTLRFSEQ